MVDKLTPEHRSRLMSHVKSKDTSVEIKVRKWLFAHGFRYRKNVDSLPGKPDIVLRKYKTIIFVHGCFWHRHEGCSKAGIPKTRTGYWLEKFQKNIERDRREQELLKDMGWNIIVLWQCELTKNFEDIMKRVALDLKSTISIDGGMI